ncbi:DUF2164 family protein, partial [Achromobacter sp. SIMBA_011]|uniref:DUF2164 family protein n=1 Tax=Achromobacter sp. SIMBA_011 TaxID=3085759 RepID=UPI003979981B
RSIKPSHVDCFYVRQPEALGLGHAVLCAEKLVADNPFAVILADDLLDGPTPVLRQMIDVFDHYHASVIGVEEIAPAIYNLAIADAQERLHARVAELDIECHAEPFEYWNKQPGR